MKEHFGPFLDGEWNDDVYYYSEDNDYGVQKKKDAMLQNSNRNSDMNIGNPDTIEHTFVIQHKITSNVYSTDCYSGRVMTLVNDSFPGP